MANKNFRVYNYKGNLPDQSELLLPHRKDHFLLVFIQSGSGRQWIDLQSYRLQNNTVYFSVPNQIIVKEDLKDLWSTGIAFTKEFLLLQENAALSKLPLLERPNGGNKLLLTADDVAFVTDILAKITIEYQTQSQWQQRMLSAYLTVLLTYLSRLYTQQFTSDTIAEKLLLGKYLAKVDECFQQLHEVAGYASLLHISAGHLGEVVKLQSGKPAIKHIHERLVLEARRLLYHTPQAIKEIAFDLGFTDTSYFNRFFKRETGSTPAAYRTTIREMYH